MAYNANIPQATDKLINSQADIKDNFTAINTLVNVNHIGFDVANSGKHLNVDLPNSATHPLVAATELLLYNFVNPTTTVNELYVKKAGALGVAGTAITARGGTTAGWTYLPSGLLVKWGTNTSQFDVTLNATPGPPFNAATMPFAAFVTANQPGLS